MAAPRRYELRLFDRTLVEFDVTDGPFGPDVVLVDFDGEARDLMPCGLDLTTGGIWAWLEARSIPTNRRNAGLVCRELGFDLGDTEALYRASLGLSLNDSYWVVPRGFAGAFDDYDLYDNDFSEAIGALCVSGTVTPGSLHGNTPELTTDGTLRKGWRIVGGRRVLYKGASEGFVPGEPASEYLVSLVARDMGVDAVRYGLYTWEGELCSTCEDFATKELSYVPFAVATGMTDLAGAIWWCASLGAGALEALCDMLALDALACNTVNLNSAGRARREPVLSRGRPLRRPRALQGAGIAQVLHGRHRLARHARVRRFRTRQREDVPLPARRRHRRERGHAR